MKRKRRTGDDTSLRGSWQQDSLASQESKKRQVIAQDALVMRHTGEMERSEGERSKGLGRDGPASAPISALQVLARISPWSRCW